MLLLTPLQDGFLLDYSTREILILSCISGVFCHALVTLWRGECHVELAETE